MYYVSIKNLLTGYTSTEIVMNYRDLSSFINAQISRRKKVYKIVSENGKIIFLDYLH